MACSSCYQIGLLKTKIMSKDFNCPHCGSDYSIDENESYHLYDTDDIEELTCGSCEKEFFVSVHKSFSFEVKTDLDDF